ncbi:MAG: CGNR zinc finger domain-containing protein [Anaerolineae bacterium]|nr:CGNR zinc finger domain-containing protein [Anaerolineae bacterium]
MGAEREPCHIFSFTSGWLCLDFCNTVGGRHPIEVSASKLKTHQAIEDAGRFATRDYLHSYVDLIEWGGQAGLLAQVTVERLEAEAGEHPDEAAEVLTQAVALRETLYRLFSALADNQQPPDGDLTALNAVLPTALAHQRLTYHADHFDWGWEETPTLDQMLWPVVRSAADLLTAPELARVRECAGETCGWLFLDMSKNHSRRWCSMDDCGNRAKAKRHYQRRKSVET